MTLSVIIPLYNKARHIRRAIESVQKQTYPANEIIVVDDGSTDGGADVVRKIADPRIRLITQANIGVSGARNRGIKEASFDLLAFLDADDEWSPCFLETVMSLRSNHPEAGLYATAYRYDNGERSWRPSFVRCASVPQGGLLDDYFLAAMGPPPVWSSAVMIPRSIFKTVGLFPVGVRRGEDLYMWAKIALRYRAAWSPAVGAIYHLSADNRACSGIDLKPDIAAASAVHDLMRSGQQPIVPLHSIEEYLTASRLPLALECHLHGHHTWALDLLVKTKSTELFRHKRHHLRMLVSLPPRILNLLLRLKSAMSHLSLCKLIPGRIP